MQHTRNRNFNPLPPHGGRHTEVREKPRTQNISIHSLRMEGDRDQFQQMISDSKFQSTPSAWRETGRLNRRLSLFSFQSTPSAWRETYMDSYDEGTATFQSTPSAWRETHNFFTLHRRRVFQSTPSAWRETLHPRRRRMRNYDFNPLPPHGGRLSRLNRRLSLFSFQSTPSAWRETSYNVVPPRH